MALTKVRGAGVESIQTLTIADGLTLSDGDVTLASGHGINFSATANSSSTMTTELFDDYEEGTLVPSATFSTPSSNGDTTGTGQYTKIGRQVTVHCLVKDIDTSGASGDMNIEGMPFVALADSGAATVEQFQGVVTTSQLNFATGYVVAEITDGFAKLRVTECRDNTTLDLINASDITDDACDMRFTITYTTAS